MKGDGISVVGTRALLYPVTYPIAHEYSTKPRKAAQGRRDAYRHGSGTTTVDGTGQLGKTRDQVTAARAAMVEWLADYPDGLGVKNKLKYLAVTEAWLRINKEWW